MYSVNHWGSHPDAGNDDCWGGADYENENAALAAFDAIAESSIAYIELDGPNINLVRANPAFEPDVKDDDWRREIAMEAGMLHGAEAYNEIMGWT